jgi:hypothetical protein
MALSQEQFAAAQAHRESRPGQQELLPEGKPIKSREAVSNTTTRSGRSISRREWGLSSLSERPVTQAPPAGYYSQKHGQQGVLPGMEMSPQEHVDAMAQRHGLTGTIKHIGSAHSLELKDPSQPPTQSAAYLNWAGKREKLMSPGEVGMVNVEQSYKRQGVADDMLTTAEKIAMEHPDIAMPKHSETRSDQGVKWSQNMMRKRGQQVW